MTPENRSQCTAPKENFPKNHTNLRNSQFYTSLANQKNNIIVPDKITTILHQTPLPRSPLKNRIKKENLILMTGTGTRIRESVKDQYSAMSLKESNGCVFGTSGEKLHEKSSNGGFQIKPNNFSKKDAFKIQQDLIIKIPENMKKEKVLNPENTSITVVSKPKYLEKV